MKLLKFILPITALIMVFAVVESTAQICVYEVGEEYKLEDAIRYKGDNLEFIKFCCDSLKRCTPNYLVENKYRLTHIAARYNKKDVLKYLVVEKNIPADSYPIDYDRGEYEKTYTPIMWSAKYDAPSAADYLVGIGASVTRKNMYNQDALDLAKTTGNAELIATIKKAWNAARGIAQANLEKNKKDLIKVLTINDIEKELKNFKREIKFNGFFA